MSGIELVGLAASILQIADLGWNLSSKLYSFSKKIHEAGKTIELISQDIGATGAILKRLSDEIGKDEKAKSDSRLCSPMLIHAANQLVDECKEIFNHIDQGIGGNDGNKVILGFRQKLKWSYLEPRVELLRTNLERLKSSLAIMLNVLIYAEQLRSREDKIVLSEQQALVASFAAQKTETEKKIEMLTKSMESTLHVYTDGMSARTDDIQGSAMHIRSGDGKQHPQYIIPTKSREIDGIPLSRHSHIALGSSQLVSEGNESSEPTQDISSVFQMPLPDSVAGPDISTSFATRSVPATWLPRLEQHRILIDKLLEEVNSSRYAVDHGMRYRLHDGVLDLHWQEWSPLRSTHGDEILRGLLVDSPVLARHWHNKLKEVNVSASATESPGKNWPSGSTTQPQEAPHTNLAETGGEPTSDPNNEATSQESIPMVQFDKQTVYSSSNANRKSAHIEYSADATRRYKRTISHTDEEWEAMREPFRKCYIDQDMSLKEATQYLTVHHGFAASERQWERQKERWNLSKYQKRETRQQYIEQALARGMHMEDILNAADLPAEGVGTDDRAARRNWRRYVKRGRSRSMQSQSHTQPHSPMEGISLSFESPGTSRQEHYVVEKTYDVNVADGIIPDCTEGAQFDSILLEATSIRDPGQTPQQIFTSSEVNLPAETNTAPEIFFSSWDDASGGLQECGPLYQSAFTNSADMSFYPYSSNFEAQDDDAATTGSTEGQLSYAEISTNAHRIDGATQDEPSAAAIANSFLAQWTTLAPSPVALA